MKSESIRHVKIDGNTTVVTELEGKGLPDAIILDYLDHTFA